MSSRLASFHGPSTPTSSPVQHKQRESTPTSPSRSRALLESTYHRKVRSSFQEIRAITETWDDLVLLDGLKAASQLINTRTELENSLALIPDRLPRTHLVGPKVAIMEECIQDLNAVLNKLQKQFSRLNAAVDGLEATLVEAHRTKGWKWVSDEPMWVTWPLEKFVTSIADILPLYHRSLQIHKDLVDKIRPHTTSFEAGRAAIAKWAEQPWLEDEGWEARWEDLCIAEIDRWDRPK